MMTCYIFLIHIYTFRQNPPTAPSPAQQPTANTTNTKVGKLQAAANTSHKVTEYFPIRRSERKPKAELLKEELETISERLSVTDDSRHGIEVVPIENKGRGIKVSWSTLLIPRCLCLTLPNYSRL